MAALNLVLLVNYHVVAQVVEAELVVGAVGDVGGVGFLSEVVLEVVYDKSDLESHVLIELAHPLGVAAGKVVVDGYDVNAVARERVEVRGQGRNEGFTFTCFHLGDTSLVEHDAAEHLYGEVLHSEHSPARLAACRERVGKNIVGRLAVCEAFLEKRRLVLELALAHCGILALKRENLVSDGLDPLDLALAVVAEK